MKFNKKYLFPFILVAAGLALSTLMDAIQGIDTIFDFTGNIESILSILSFGFSAAVLLSLAFVFFKDQKVYPIFVLIALGLKALCHIRTHLGAWGTVFTLAQYDVNWTVWFNQINSMINSAVFAAFFIILFFVFLKAFKAKEEKKIYKILPFIAFCVLALSDLGGVLSNIVTAIQMAVYEQSAGSYVSSIFSLLASAAMEVGCGLYFILSDYVIAEPAEK